jgi:hypothetical protein
VEEEGYSTAEAAAIEDVPGGYVEVLGWSLAPDGDHAVFLLSLNEEPAVGLYLQPCYREEGRWHPGPEDWGVHPGGGGRAVCSFGPSRATALIVDGSGPDDAAEAVLTFEGEQRRVPMARGHYLFVVWEPEDPAAEVAVTGFA